MANENETVVEIVKDMKECEGFRAYYDGGKYHESREEDVVGVDLLYDYANRVEKANECEVAELRECLKEAVALHCDNLAGDCLHCIRCGVCNYLKWRKALEGGESNGK